ncbi:MAG TPA: hypothetical protein VJZ27_04580 [Aggregatilineales bacterium]|nr:hypothetical protein [Aggregatilineales bacterium]
MTQDEKKESKSKTHPLEAFVRHQGKALQELGKAVLSILPKGVRDHGGNAIKESAKGFSTLGNAVMDEVGKAADSVSETVSPKRKKTEKVEVQDAEEETEEKEEKEKRLKRNKEH